MVGLLFVLLKYYICLILLVNYDIIRMMIDYVSIKYKNVNLI